MISVINDIIKWGLEYIGRYYSTYKGYVIDNVDPDGQNRVLVSCPTVWNRNDYSKWAYPESIYSGKGFGMQLLPQIGEQIHVIFDHGDKRYPMWKHANYTENELPVDFQDPTTKGFITPNGTKIIIIDNGDGTDNVLIDTKGTITYNHGTNTTAKADILTQQLTKMSNRIDGIMDAIKNATVTPSDGGATFKANIIAAFPTDKESFDGDNDIENKKILH